jgi:hypothetical protein
LDFLFYFFEIFFLFGVVSDGEYGVFCPAHSLMFATFRGGDENQQ